MRLLSYNIHKGIGGRDRRYHIGRIIDVIEEENPDLICLQEVTNNVRRSQYHDQPAMIAEYFNSRDKLFQLNVHMKTGGYGNLILSRWQFQSHHNVSLRWNRKKIRGAQLVVVNTPEGNLHLVNTHLGLGERERQWQVTHLLGHHLFREAEHLPTVLLGDYNDWRNTLAKGSLQEAGFKQVTTPASRYRTFPAYLAAASLDKAFCRGDITVKHVRVVRTRAARTASDHLPLVVDLHLGK